MATNHTTNYQLNQWLSTDQVLRADFNADNAKIDAALHAVDRRRLQVLQSYALEEASSEVIISLEDLDWSQWRTVHIDVVPAAGSSNQLYVCYGRSFLDRIGVCSTTWNHLILLPYGQPEMRVTALFWGDSMENEAQGPKFDLWLPPVPLWLLSGHPERSSPPQRRNTPDPAP